MSPAAAMTASARATAGAPAAIASAATPSANQCLRRASQTIWSLREPRRSFGGYPHPRGPDGDVSGRKGLLQLAATPDALAGLLGALLGEPVLRELLEPAAGRGVELGQPVAQQPDLQLGGRLALDVDLQAALAVGCDLGIRDDGHGPPVAVAVEQPAAQRRARLCRAAPEPARRDA